MSSPGTLRFAELAATPSPPPVGYAILYMKTDDVLYLQDSSGTEIALGSASSITQLVGEATATGPGVTTITLSNAAVIGKVLTGFSAGPNSTVLATDSILEAIEKLQAQVSGTSGTAITALTGDVSATGPGSVAATVNSVGGSSAANINTATIAANAATATNTASTIVKRDASGNFAATTITANLTGNASGSAGSFTGALVGDVTGTQGATVVSLVGGATAANVATSVSDTQAATSSNTASTIVKRNASGNFSANIITASLSGNATTSTTSTNFTGSLAGDVTGTQSATTVALVGGKTAAQVSTSVDDTLAATATNTASTIVKRDASGNFAAGTITAALSGNATTATTATSFSGSLVGDVTGTQGATVVSTVGGKTAAQVATSVNDTLAATASNTASTIVKRDGSGNFAAGTITANLTGTATNATTAVNFSGSLSGDVTGTQGATAISDTTVSGKLLTGYVVGANTPIAATDSILQAFQKTQGQINATTGAAITSLTGDATATGPGAAALTLATVNGNVGTFGTASSVSTVTVNAKGLVTAASNTAIQIAESQVTNLVTDLAGKQATGNYITALTGDVTATGPGSVATTIAANAVTNAKLAQMPTLTIKGNNTGGTANALDLTVSQVNTMLGTVTSVSASSPLQSSGGATPTISFINQTANTILAGPASGASAAPTFRSLVVADIPLRATTTKSANYTMTAADDIIFIDTSGGAFTLTLPSPTGLAGKMFSLIGISGTMQTNNLTLARSGSEKIEGLAANKVFQTNWGWYNITTNGTDWFTGG